MRQQTQRGGYALTLAIALMGLVAAVLVAVSGWFGEEAGRTRKAAEDAQMRQLLLAGEIHARAMLTDAGPDRRVELPAPLREAGATLTVIPVRTADANRCGFEVSARLGRRSAGQKLEFERSGERWVLRQAVGSKP